MEALARSLYESTIFPYFGSFLFNAQICPILLRLLSNCPENSLVKIRRSNVYQIWNFFVKNSSFICSKKIGNVESRNDGKKNPIKKFDSVFWKGPNFCTKFGHLNDFSNDELHIILKCSNFVICKHSSFFSYWWN